MINVFNLLFAWLPSGLAALLIAFICVFVLAFFVGLILKIIDIIRG